MTDTYPCYKIKEIESIEMHSAHERQEQLDMAKNNLFSVPSRFVSVDLLTDSGTGAMSNAQRAAMELGDESYAGSRSFAALSQTVEKIFGYEHFMPVHQGRAAENIISEVLVRSASVTLSNGHFDTTLANILHAGAIPTNIPCAEALESDSGDAIFKGNIELDTLRSKVAEHARGDIDVSLVILTVTNNALGGYPVSMENIRRAHCITREYNIPLFLDSARIFENAFFIQQHDAFYKDHSIEQIVRVMCSYSDGMWMSSKKNGLVNIGGLLCVRDASLYEKCRARLVEQEGFVHYGGMAGRDLAALSVGLVEGMQPEYLHSHINGTVRYLGEALGRIGVPVLKPFGGHAVFVDAGAMLPHIPAEHFPGQALALELFREGGVRSCEIGSVMFPSMGNEHHATRQLLRLAVPRRVYTREHMDWVVRCFAEILKRSDSIRGCRITKQPERLRHFFCEFEILE